MKKVNIFVSYSHENSPEFAEVSKILKSVEGAIGIELWDDTKIKVGDKWKNEIEKALKKADLGILLVTTSFLTSQFIKEEEVKQLLLQYNKRKTKIIIVILRECAWKKINWLNEFQLFNNGIPLWGKNVPKARREGYLVKLIDNLDEIVKATQSEVSSTHTSQPQKKLSAQDIDELPFTNQDTLRELLKPPQDTEQSTFTYVSLTGSAGQGKTRLLLKLKDKYKDEGWDCGYSLFDPEKGEKAFVKNLINDLGIPFKDIRGNKNLGKEFYTQYTEHKKKKRKPLALFIDTLGSVTKNDIWILDNNFIEDLDKYIKDDEYLDQHGKYRLFLAGRNLPGDLIDSQNPEKYNDFKLSPFRYENVLEMVINNNVFGRLKYDAKIDFAADILYLSGGHPSLMAKIVNRYKEEKINRQGFVEGYIKEHWNSDLTNTMNAVSSGIFDKEKRIKEFAERTVALRYFNKPIIKKIFKGQAVENIISNVINRSGLYRESDESGLFSDGAIRDIYALHLLASEPETFKLKCREAQALCWDEIASGIKIEEFMAEYLFQCLQESIAYSKNNIHNQRKTIRRRFEKKLDVFIGDLAEIRRGKERKEELLGGLINILKRQADASSEDRNKALFRFWIIYIYKDKSYSINVYKDFVSGMKNKVDKHFGRRKK